MPKYEYIAVSQVESIGETLKKLDEMGQQGFHVVVLFPETEDRYATFIMEREIPPQPVAIDRATEMQRFTREHQSD